MEEPLGGGNFTPEVVRAGRTVRRPASAASPFVTRLLTHLTRRGFTGSPRHLGVDGRGRDVFSYIPGDVEPRWRRRTDAQVVAGAKLLRGLHDATRDLAARIGGGEVVCHHDPGPNNAIFVAGLPVAFVDFDFAAVGDPLEDVAYLAWGWCVSAKADRQPAGDQAYQVRLAADTYGLDRPADLLPALVRRLRSNEDFWRSHPDHPRWRDFLEWTGREIDYVHAHRDTFAAALAR
jgi:Ser/Thr protein kinase RdoA (MazF antagonist)